jgi:hypothetical protein
MIWLFIYNIYIFILKLDRLILIDIHLIIYNPLVKLIVNHLIMYNILI